MARKATAYLSDRLNTRVEIGTVEIEFLKTVVLNDVYIEDLHHDTLLFSHKLKVDLGRLDFDNRTVSVSSIVLLNTKASLVKYYGEEDLNFQFILDALAPKDSVKTKSDRWDVDFGKVTFVNTGFAYRNEQDTINTTGINFTDISVSNINGRFTDIRFDGDTIYGGIDYLSAIEKSGFILKSLSSYVKVSPTELTLNELKMQTPHSTVETDLVLSYKSYRDFNDFINKVKIKAQFNRSLLEVNDIAYFAPELKGLYRTLTVSGKISGRINDLRGKDIYITTGLATRFAGDVTLTGLPKIEETLIHLSIRNLSTNYADLREIPVPPFAAHGKLQVPSNLAKLGNMKFKGTFTGLYNDFYAYGDFNSALGRLSSDLSVRRDSLRDREVYKGKLKSTNFDFGRFFDVPALGKATMNVDVDGSGLTLEEIAAELKGTVNSLEFNNYTYKNIAVEGNIAKQIFKGKLNVKDDNIDFDFIGKVDFTGKLPNLDFVTTLNKADLAALHFIKTDKKTDLSTQVIINVTGSNIDNMVGQINFDNTIFRQENEVYKLSVFNLISEENNGIKTIRLFSDFVEARVHGTFKVLDLSLAMEDQLRKYLPSLFDQKQKPKNIAAQNFEYSFLFNKTEAVTKLFLPEVTIAPKTLIKGSFNSAASDFRLTGTSSRLNVYGYVFKDWTADASTSSESLDFRIGAKRLYLSDSLWMNDFSFSTVTSTDSVNMAVNWDNKSERVNRGDIKAFMSVRKSNSFEFKIQPSEFTINDSTWSVKRTNDVVIDSNYITVQDLTFEHDAQSISLNGVISKNKQDQLKLDFVNFNLANLNAFVKPFGIRLKGTIDGQSVLTDLYKDMVFTSNNNFKKFVFNDNELGDGAIESVWDKGKEALYVHGSFTQGIVPNILFSGYYYPKREQDNLDLELNLQAMRMQLFEPFIKEYCSEFKGFFAGNVTVKGSVKEPKVSGLINVNAKKVTVSYLNTTYNFSHDIVIENNSFGVENLVLYDVNHNKATVTGKLYHDNFKNFQLDYDISARKFMCLNTTEINNDLYYGKAFITGIVNISGFVNDYIRIDASVKTDKVSSSDKSDKVNLISTTEITKFFIPLSSNSEIGENNFITFVKKDSSISMKNDYKIKISGLILDFDLEVTPDAEVQLIFDEKVGDVIKARGSGNISLDINTRGDFKMYGDYVIDEGDYLFTLQNIINKRFYIEKGGLIKWSGVPYKAELDLSAVYKARAALQPFFPEDSTGRYKKRSPIDVRLLMSGDLLSPQLNFAIGIPTVDASTRQQVLSYINSDAETNRQVFSLLVLNSFVTPSQLSNTAGGPTAGNALSSNSSEMLSNQLSNMLSKISNDFDVGVNYRPGDAISKDELEVALSTQLFNDKLIVDGNVGNNTNSQSTNNIVGDVNVEYKLTEDGKVRIKTFNRANDNSQINMASGDYTQGVGIFYREEFDTLGELFKRYLAVIQNRRKKTPEKDPEPDTTITIDPDPSENP